MLVSMGLGFTPAGGGPEIPIDLGRPDCGNPGQAPCPASGSGPFGNALALVNDPRIRAVLGAGGAAAPAATTAAGVPMVAPPSSGGGRLVLWLGIGAVAVTGAILLLRR